MDPRIASQVTTKSKIQLTEKRNIVLFVVVAKWATRSRASIDFNQATVKVSDVLRCADVIVENATLNAVEETKFWTKDQFVSYTSLKSKQAVPSLQVVVEL